MIKALFYALPVVIVLNLLAAAGFVGWLYQSGRLNAERVDRVVAMFKPTIAEEEKVKAEEAAAQEAADAKAAIDARMAKVSAGGKTLSQTLEEQMTSDEASRQRAARVSQEVSQLRTQMQNFERLMDQREATLAQAKKNFKNEVDKQIEKVKDEDFQQTVKLMESLEPKAVKGVFDNMMAQNQTDQVIEYLAAMNGRKAAGVLGEYKGDEEAPVLADLLQRLDRRRAEPLEQVAQQNASLTGP